MDFTGTIFNKSQMPLRVYARLDADSAPRWWLTTGDGWYCEWQPNEKECNMPRRRVRAERLVFAKLDDGLAHYAGDAAAIQQIVHARQKFEAAKN